MEQPITDFLNVEEPAQALVLIEAGPAVYLLEGSHLRAAQEFLSGLSPDDRVAVVKYADAPQGLVDFTINKQSVAAAFDDLGFNLGFGSLNLSASLSKVLDWLTSVQGKKTIVLLSTGVDTSSTKQIQDLLNRLQTSDVRILAVSLTGDLRNPPPAAKKEIAIPKSGLHFATIRRGGHASSADRANNWRAGIFPCQLKRTSNCLRADRSNRAP